MGDGRGLTWQRRVEDQHILYAKAGMCVWVRNEPIRVKRRNLKTAEELADFDERVRRGKGAPDYTVGFSGVTIYVEVKEYQSKVWPFSQLQPHQADRMDEFRRHGFASFILLRLAGRTWLIPWDTLAYPYRMAALSPSAQRSFNPAKDTSFAHEVHCDTDYLPIAKNLVRHVTPRNG